MSSFTFASEQFTAAAAKRYLVGLAASFVLVSGSGAIFNFLRDPFALFRLPPIPEYFTHARLAKAQAIKRVRPKAVILGTSRAEIGFDAAYPGFGVRPVYNLALSGANLHEIVRYLEHAHAVSPLAQAVLEVEFFAFNAARKPTPDFDASVLRTPGATIVARAIEQVNLGRQLLSYDMLSASFHSLSTRPVGPVSYHLPDGRVEHAGARAQVEAQGHFVMFGPPLRSMMDSREVYADFKTVDAATGESTFSEFRRLLKFCREQVIDLRIVITPSHALLYEAIRHAGSWDAFEEWKRELTRLVSAEAAERAGVGVFPLWDFSGYNSITTEAVPAEGDRVSRMRWFWEAVHIKRETGDLVLSRILGDGNVEVPGDFGRRLTPDMLEMHLLETRTAREQYLSRNAALVDAVLR